MDDKRRAGENQGAENLASRDAIAERGHYPARDDALRYRVAANQ